MPAYQKPDMGNQNLGKESEKYLDLAVDTRRGVRYFVKRKVPTQLITRFIS